MPLDEVDGTRPVSDVVWNPATKLFEVSVFRGRGPPLVVRNLSLGAADRLRGALNGALRWAEPEASDRGYAGSCIRTSKNRPSTRLSE